MNTEHTSNQIIIGDYTFDGRNYNALLECTQNDFDHLVKVMKGQAKESGQHIVVEANETNGHQQLFIDGTPSCGYDRKRGMMYGFIFDSMGEMDKEDSDRLRNLFESYSREEIEEAIEDIAGEDGLVRDDENAIISDKELVVEFIAFLEGYAIRFKEFHWNAGGKALHEAAEKAYNLVYTLEDSIAEDMMGWMNSKIKPGSINPVFPAERAGDPQNTVLSLSDVLDMLKDDAFSFYTKIENNNNFIGIRSEVEDFLHEINQLIYLAKLV